jgi:hypothetical protein
MEGNGAENVFVPSVNVSSAILVVEFMPKFIEPIEPPCGFFISKLWSLESTSTDC